MDKDLESLYKEAQSALKAKEYMRASDRLRQILKADRNYKNSARLLARITRLSRRRWYNDPRLWGSLRALLLIGLGICLLPVILGCTSQTVPPSVSPTTETHAPTMAVSAPSTATATPLPTATTVPFTWVQISTGGEFERDTVAAIAIDPKDPAVLYVGMKHAGIYKSIDSGLSWHPVHDGLTSAHVTSLLIDPKNPQTLYAGTLEGIYKTDNGSNLWYRIGEGTHVLMDPQDSSHLYARNNENIYESTNQGKSWKTVYSTQEGCPDKIHTWAVHPVEGKTLFIVGGEECEPGLYLSGDDGKTWTLEETANFCTDGLMIGLGRQGKYHVADYCGVEYAFLIPLPTFDQLYSYWGNDSRLFKEGLNGEQRLTLGKPDVGFVTVLAISPDDPDMIYAGGKGLSVSKNGGLTWAQMNNGLGILLTTLETGEGNPPILYLQEECDTSSFPYLMEKFDYLTNGKGKKESGQPLFISKDGGKNWDLASETGCYLIKDADGITLYRIARAIQYCEGCQNPDGYIWKSQDGGQTWKKVIGVHHYWNLKTLVAHPTQSGTLFALHSDPYGLTGYTEQQFISKDYGKQWERVPPPLEFFPCYGETARFIKEYRPMAIDPQDGNHVFVIDNGALLESHDSCETTSAFGTAPNTNMNSIAFDPSSPGILYAGTDQGAYISFDSGGTWHQINDGLIDTTVVYSIVVDKDGNVYAATPYGIFKLEGK
jgi:photosystem II stability/assembly factor-like uncharacterized protein